MADLIKKADMDYFQRNMYNAGILQKNADVVRNILGSFVNDISSAIDLTNDCEPLVIVKRNIDEYSFTRVLQRKLVFDTVENVVEFLDHRCIILHKDIVGSPVELPGTKITYITFDLEDDIRDARLVFSVKELALCAISIVGAPVFLCMLFARNQKRFRSDNLGSFQNDIE